MARILATDAGRHKPASQPAIQPASQVAVIMEVESHSRSGMANSLAHFGLDVGVALTGVGNTGGAMHVQLWTPPVVAHAAVGSVLAPAGHGTSVKFSQLAGGSWTQMPSL